MHPVEDEELQPAEAVEEPAASRPQIKAKGLAGQTGSRSAAQLLCAGRGRLGYYRRKTASKEDDPYAGVGRNAPCPCGSGKKFKMCHGRPGAA